MNLSCKLPLTMTVLIPVLNGGELFQYLCKHLERMVSIWGFDVIVIDSGSSDGSDRVAERSGFLVKRISKDEFGHGKTRNQGVRMAQSDVVCLMTQDVLPCTPDWPLRFTETFLDPKVAGVYGRQVPRNAETAEMFFVALNYPSHSFVYDPSPEGFAPKPGRVLFSNAFSAIRRSVALEIPYEDNIPVSEDQAWGQKVLRGGWKIAYCAEAEALHAHRYTTRALFQRTFLVGQALKMMRQDGGASFSESVRFLMAELGYFVRQGRTHRIPLLIGYEFIRWLGFQVGRRHPPF